MPNPLTTRYIDECVDRPDLGSAARRLVLPEAYAKSYGHLLLDRPLLADEREVNGFADDLVVLFDILVALPNRLFDGDLRRYCAALGMDERVAALLCRGATGQPLLHGRADAYHDGTSFKLLEFNVGSELGGTDAAQMNRGFLDVPAFREFAEGHRLGYVDTASRVASALRTAAESVAAGPEPVVALIESTGGLAAHEHVFIALREAMADHGIELRLGEIHELDERGGKLTLHGTPVDVVLRYFAAGELIDDPRSEEMLDQIMRAHADGRTALFTPLEGALFASKGSLGLLHDPRVRESLSTAEREVVDRVVPWTRLLADGPWQARGDRAELIDRCRADRAVLVLKPGIGYGGVGTVIGHEATDDAWRAALDNCAGGDYVAQRLVSPAPEPVVDPGGLVENWHANWGIFVDRAGYAGGFVRALKAEDGTVISYSNPGTRGTCVFTYPGA